MKKRLSIIVGRFQCTLHAGHVDFINKVINKSDNTVILLGTPRTKGTKENPLDYETRKLMFNQYFPSLKVFKALDFRYNEAWSKNIDKIVLENFSSEEYDIFICGSRDSCLPSYSGSFIKDVLEHSFHESGTTERDRIGKAPKSTEDFRDGVIYSTQNRYDQSVQAVDVAPLNDNNQVLLAMKPDENKWRFAGGHVDPSDSSLEETALREGVEELGNIQLEDPKYIKSFRVDDWRYRRSKDKIMTVLYTCKYVFGKIEARDDIMQAKWFDIDEINLEDIMEEHVPLMKQLLETLNKY